MKNLAVSLVLAAAFSLPVFAGAVKSNINFALPEGAPLPTSGSFNYDPAAGFSDFLVQWAGVTFDLTSAANGMTLTADPPTGCGPSDGSAGHQYAYVLMTQTATGCDARYAWSGVYYGLGMAQLSFILNPGGSSSSQDLLIAMTLFPPDESTPFNWVVGSWTVTAESSVPEPGTVGLMLLGALTIAGMKTARGVRTGGRGTLVR
ncbi:MAG: PEP-CTERM sorting domain-containing protein [Candidatus Solibacter sp.]|nr:PEP-CTERM sorting domain-containing protein [Candidatus Solibacter sp.]